MATGRPCESRTVPTAEDEIRKMVTAELARGAAALWATHDAAQARRLAQRCLFVEQGQVTEGRP